jgi:hypothetical protein
MEFIAFLFLALVYAMLIGTSKKIKIIFGGLIGALVSVFIAGSLIIKYQTGFFHMSKSAWRTSDASITIGKWVIPFYVIAALILLILFNFRFIKKAVHPDIQNTPLFCIILKEMKF